VVGELAITRVIGAKKIGNEITKEITLHLILNLGGFRDRCVRGSISLDTLRVVDARAVSLGRDGSGEGQGGTENPCVLGRHCYEICLSKCALSMVC
jgi:hypothetical protein